MLEVDGSLAVEGVRHGRLRSFQHLSLPCMRLMFGLQLVETWMFIVVSIRGREVEVVCV